MNACPFCTFADKDVIIYDEPLVLACVSREPINGYHALVFPRNHVESFIEIPDEVLTRIFVVAKRVSAAVRKVSQAAAITHMSDDDLVGGYNQIAHYKLHIIPRFPGDGITIDWARDPDPGMQVRAQYATELRHALVK